MRITVHTKLMLVTFATLAALHIIAIELSLYWHFWWFDIPMHFFGGAIVALGLYTLRDLRFPLPKALFRCFPFMLGVLGIALIWEGFELWAGIPIEPDFVFDTSLDLVMGLMGGFLGYHLGRQLSAL
jgi:hypothetical protein